MSKSTLKNLLTVTITVAITLVIAEFAAPHLVLLRNVGPSFTQHDPVLWKRLKANFETERVTLEFRMKFSTNSLSARGPEPKGDLKGSVLFLGDSFTMGYGVSDGEEFPALVQHELIRRKGKSAPYVMNLGMGAAGNGFWLKRLTHTAPALQPSLVVLQVMENDFWDNQVENLYELDPNGRLVEQPVPQPNLTRRIQTVIESIPGLASTNLMGLVRQALSTDPASGFFSTAVPEGAASAPVKAALEPGDTLTLRLVEAAIQRCRDKGWPVAVMTVGLDPAQLAAIQQIAQAQQAPMVALPSKDEQPDGFYPIDGHWNALGNQIAAQKLLALLDEHRLLER